MVLASCLLRLGIVVAASALDPLAGIKGTNYVPSYSKVDVLQIFDSRTWNATIVDQELRYAKMMDINSLRVFLAYGAYKKDPQPEVFFQNYVTFLHLLKAHNLTLMATVTSKPPCEDTIAWYRKVVAAEVPGVIIAYEAANEPSPWAMPWVKNCSLPALLEASKNSTNPDIKVGVGYAHFREALDTAHIATSINWHSYTGIRNGTAWHSGDTLQYEIDQLRKIANKYNPPKPLILTEWMSRPTQPLATVYPVIRDNQVTAYSWALVIVECTSHWNRPVAKGDPPFQGLIWPNGTAYDDLEEGECMRTSCRTLEYVHHCCNANDTQDSLFAFSDNWETIASFGQPVYNHGHGPRLGSLRQTNSSSAHVTIGPLPPGTRRVALYLPIQPNGTAYTVKLNGRDIYHGTTRGETTWDSRVVLPLPPGTTGSIMLAPDKDMPATSKLELVGATFFSTADPKVESAGPTQLIV